MFIRFRETQSRLQVSVVETRRVKVRHEHIAQLGSVPVPPSIADRIAFWKRLSERLAKLSNRIDAEAQAKIISDIDARIPIVTLDEMQQLKIENAEAEERVWSSIHAMEEEQVGGQKKLMAEVERAIAVGSEAMNDAAARIADAKDRAERLRKGEDVPGGLGKPKDKERILRNAGWTTADIRHRELLASLPEEATDVMIDASMKARKRAERATARRLGRKLRDDVPSVGPQDHDGETGSTAG
jgi:hypothetical protein